MTSVTSLPPDLLYHFALTYLLSKDIIALDRCNKYLHVHLSKSITHDFWKDLYRRDLSEYPVVKENFDYKKEYLNGITTLLKELDGRPYIIATNGFEKCIDIKPSINDCMLMFRVASKAGHLHIVDLVLSLEPNLDINTLCYCSSPLEMAVKYNHLHVARRLIELGANTDVNFLYVSSYYDESKELKERLRNLMTKDILVPRDPGVNTS